MQKQNNPPQIDDYSKQAIDQAVFKTGLTHWLTLYPPAVGIPAGIAGFLFGMPFLSVLGAGTVFFSLANAVINIFFRNKAIAGQYINELNKRLKAHEKEVLQNLEKDLNALSTVEGARDMALQGVQQFSKIKVKYQNVRDLLEEKFSTNEMTFARFLGSAEQVYLGTLDNLRQVAATLKSLSSIDLSYIRQKLDELSEKTEKKAADLTEIEALQKRLSLWEEQIGLANDLLAKNEEAMTKMEETTFAVSSLKTGSAFGETDLESAMAQLQELARQAPIYNK
ncbi:hypothetical protein [uncultured Desulfobacter sp.]|uniref:hypothetical protein n=1 Tax=uncultured Desulfobacter sp. TaxID=240139 RepID=UPI002AAB7707|nr:hypothetical protein [uncultured Desulfobacter sp.]